MQSLRQDLLLGIRSLRKEPASAIITSLTLALGIGLCTISFSLLYGVFFRGLDVPEPNRLVVITRTNSTLANNEMWVTQHDFYDWREQQQTFEGLAGVSQGTVNLAGPEGPERYLGAFVTANIFDLLRVQPVLGSGFRADDDLPGAPLTVVLGHSVWRDRFNSDPAIVGKPVVVNGEPATIRGVMREGFAFPETQVLWVVRRDSRATVTDRARGPAFKVYARMKPGVDRDQASRDLALVAQRLATAYPASNKNITAVVKTVVQDDTNPQLIAVFSAIQVATLFVLLIAIANVANLLMARATLRTREAAVRTALGASRFRVALPFFAETLILSGAGAALGMVIAAFGVHRFDVATQGVGKPYYMVFALDVPVIVFVLGITLLTALLASAAPAFYVLKTDVNVTLKDEVRGSSGVLGGRLTKVLVTAEIALSCALLVGAGLMVRSIVKLRNFEFPFTTEHIFTARLGLFDTEYPNREVRLAFFRGLLERLGTMPGAQSAALTSGLPLNNGTQTIALTGESYARSLDHPTPKSAFITPGYFATFGVTMRRGRDFAANDNAQGARVAIVNEEFVRKYLGQREPLGQRFSEVLSNDSLGPEMTIVGVVPNLRMQGFDPDDKSEEGYYTPMDQRDPRFVSIAVRTAGDTLGLSSQVREVVRGLSANTPIYDVLDMHAVVRQAGWFYVVFGTLFIVVGGAALFMATVGLYGVLSFSVSRRMKEMGIRMALGANAGDVTRLVLRQGSRQLGVGLFLGLVAAFGLTRVIGMLMFEITPQDPPVFTLVVVLIAGVGLIASLVPARRATRAEPTAALRAE